MALVVLALTPIVRNLSGLASTVRRMAKYIENVYQLMKFSILLTSLRLSWDHLIDVLDVLKYTSLLEGPYVVMVNVSDLQLRSDATPAHLNPK